MLLPPVLLLLLPLGAQAPPAARTSLHRVIFGAGRLEPGDVEAVVSGENVTGVRAWMGSVVDPIGDGKWRVKMRIPSEPPPSASLGNLPGARARAEGPIPGFLIETADSAAGTVRLASSVGEIAFRPAEIDILHPAIHASGLVRIEKAPVAMPLASTEADEDYPALAASPGGQVWAAWVSYDGTAERLLLARIDGGGRREPIEVTEGPGEMFRPQVAIDRDGRVWVVWSELRRDNWDLYARAWQDGRWSPIRRLTDDPGPDAYAALAADRAGTLWLAWQGHRNSPTSDIFLKSCRDGRWSDAARVIAPHPANDAEPAVVADGSGVVHVAWDSYRNGTHDIYLASIRGTEVSAGMRVTGGDRLHIRPALAVDRQDRVWIAWEEGDENWGKDTVQARGGLHRERRVRLACLQRGRLYEPAEQPDIGRSTWAGEMSEMARLEIDGAGRLWLLFRMNYMQRLWQAAAVYYEGNRWSAPLVLDRSFGRQSAAFASAISRGELWIAYAGDTRTERETFRVTGNNVYVARIQPGFGGVSAPLPGALLDVPAAASRPWGRGWPEHRMQTGGKSYRLVWGELHRHTDIDHHGRPDGALEDAYRYARDAAAMDFIATTDHISPSAPGEQASPVGLNPITWWRSQKFADLNRVPGFFEPLYAYENSKNSPQGHRNIVFPRRGGVLFGGVQGDSVTDPRPLWAALRRAGAPVVAIPHQLTGPPIDWSLHDPAFTPVMEIYQSRRQNYEYDGAPQPPGVEQVWGRKDGSWAWDALAKGYKMGFIASADHMSTHMAYAAAYVEELSREGLFGALLRRHTYAASENIVLDFRLIQEDREYMMGEEAVVRGAPRFRIRVIGTAPVARLEVVSNGKFVFSQEPGAREVDVQFADGSAPAAESYYYVRVRQQDGHLAWSSPIWIRAGR